MSRYFCYGCGRFVNFSKVDLSDVCQHFVESDNDRTVKHCVCMSCKKKYPNTMMSDLPRAVRVDHTHTFISKEELETKLKECRDKITEILLKYKEDNESTST